MLFQLIDGGIKQILSDTESWGGCETCDWGSQYINEFTIEMTTGTIDIKVDTMYEFALSEGAMMEIILPNIDHIKTLTEFQFFDWIKNKVKETANEHWCKPEEIEVNFQ